MLTSLSEISSENKGIDAPAPAPSERDVAQACAAADWVQVVSNGGPPCFHVEDGRFCFRAQRWAGHGSAHAFMSLLDFYRSQRERVEEADASR